METLTEDEYKKSVEEVLGSAPSDRACQIVHSYVTSISPQPQNDQAQAWKSSPRFLAARLLGFSPSSDPDPNRIALGDALGLEKSFHDGVPLKENDFKRFLKAFRSADTWEVMALLHSLVKVLKLQRGTNWRLLIAAYTDPDPFVALPALLALLFPLSKGMHHMPKTDFARGVVGALSHDSPCCRAAAAFIAHAALGDYGKKVENLSQTLKKQGLVLGLICLLRKGPHQEVSQDMFSIAGEIIQSTEKNV
jgi:hypothetical protein